MITILKVIELSSDYLKKKGVASPRLNAEILLAHVLGCKRMDLYLKFDQPLSIEETDNYREFIKRRGKREPMQYIIASVEFYGLEFKVNKNALIPRSETEILVEEVINESKNKENIKILDIGSGTGNIAITLAKEIQKSIVHSIDINEKAIELAKENAIINKLNENIDFYCKDISLYKLNSNEKYDIIVSNPPYISNEEYLNLEKELLDFEPANALTDYEDGFKFYKIIAQKLKELLKPKGKIFLEVGKDQADIVSKILYEHNVKNIRIVKDYQQIERVVVGEFE